MQNAREMDGGDGLMADGWRQKRIPAFFLSPLPVRYIIRVTTPSRMDPLADRYEDAMRLGG